MSYCDEQDIVPMARGTVHRWTPLRRSFRASRQIEIGKATQTIPRNEAEAQPYSWARTTGVPTTLTGLFIDVLPRSV
ncbi:hypothetical protein HYQ45_004030 [Verticillium longisporum]|uniref:Uncharacterized protein n=1 Tax=Verticillium longisporum TaxID=100787 RepID=A0A8I2ZWV9_VERLO|nr:hypothetical protein HYQ45_004030 [Verticillium longisporum]